MGGASGDPCRPRSLPPRPRVQRPAGPLHPRVLQVRLQEQGGGTEDHCHIKVSTDIRQVWSLMYFFFMSTFFLKTVIDLPRGQIVPSSTKLTIPDLCDRRAFPCMDEPTFKSTFKTTLVRPSQGGYIALSNMPEESTLEDHPGLATNSIFLRFLFVKNHCFACRANQ